MHALVKKHIFHPLFLSVPSLDRYPRLFPSRVTARELILTLEEQLLAALPSRHVQEKLGVEKLKHSDRVGDTVLERLDAAFLDGRFTPREYIDNLKSG